MKKALFLLIAPVVCYFSCKKSTMHEIDYGVFSKDTTGSVNITYTDAHGKQLTLNTAETHWEGTSFIFDDGSTVTLKAAGVGGRAFDAQIWDNGHLVADQTGSNVTLSYKLP